MSKYWGPTLCLRQRVCGSIPNSREEALHANSAPVCERFGPPKIFVLDLHPTQKKREVNDFCSKIGTTLKALENETQWANRAELYIGLIKEATHKDMQEMHSSLVLWDHAMDWQALIYQVTSRNLFQLSGTNPYTATFGGEEDIPHIFQF